MTEKFGGGYLNEGEDRFGYCVACFFAARWWSSLALEIGLEKKLTSHCATGLSLSSISFEVSYGGDSSQEGQ
jgi:hypothetical protein